MTFNTEFSTSEVTSSQEMPHLWGNLSLAPFASASLAQKSNFLSALNVTQGKNLWIEDSGAFNNMTGNINVFHKY